MIILLSPAKSLNFDSPLPDAHQPLETSQPQFEQQAEKLVRPLARMSKKRLQQIMPVSDKLIELNYRRYRNFHQQDERSAIHAFNGDVYTGFEVRTLEAEALAFAQRHVRILSGLYGVLRPLDAIRPYRLEMGTRWAPRYKNLVSFWGDKLAGHLAEEVAQTASGTIINLASQEYYAAVDKGLAKRKLPVIHIDFRQQGPDGPRFVSFDAKRARGMAARFLCEHHHQSPEALKDFDTDGYRYDADNSDDDHWCFIRN